MVANPAKFQIISPGTDINIPFNIGPYTITKEVKLLGITRPYGGFRIRSFLSQHQGGCNFSFLPNVILLIIIRWYGCSPINGLTLKYFDTPQSFMCQNTYILCRT